MNVLLAAATAYLAVLAGAALAGRLLGRLVRRTDDPLRWYRRCIAVLTPAAGIAAFGALETTGAFRALATALPMRSGVGHAGFLAVVALSTVPVMFVPYLASARTYGDLRGREIDPMDALRQLVRYLFSLLVPLGVMLWFAFLVDGDSLVAWAVLVAGAALLAVATPLLVSLGRRTRPPTADERERIDAARGRASVSVRGVRVMPTADGDPQVVVNGAPGFRYLFLTDAALDEFDDEGLAALVAVTGSHADYHLQSVGLLVYGVAASLASTAGGGPFLAFLAGYVVSNEGIRLLSYRADAASVGGSDLDPAAVATTLERVAAMHDREESPSAVARALLSLPDFPRRIAAFRARTAGGEPKGGGSR